MKKDIAVTDKNLNHQYQNVTDFDYDNILKRQKEFFQRGKTLDVNYRIDILSKLYNAIIKYNDDIEMSLKKDLGKSKTESYLTEIGIVLASINFTKKNLKKWIKKKRVKSPIYNFYSSSYIDYVPYGCVLIMAPFNYPFQLLMEPLIAAISAGNCCIVSPSDATVNVNKVIKKIINEVFNEEYVYCTDGTIETNSHLLNCKFDYIFFTGSVNVGKIVMKSASEKLIPLTLELGGKSPVIVDETANLDVVCNRLVWGKFLNAGQTCVAPDYVYVHESIYDKFVEKVVEALKIFYSSDIKNNEDYGRIVNKRQFDRLVTILNNDKEFIFYGGNYDETDKFIEPSILLLNDVEASCMKEEIFGPIMPILKYSDLTNVIDYINQGEIPLALYIFSEDKSQINLILSKVQSGGVSVNDTISHIINPYLPFGGKGSSGMGNYHGKYGFLTFSHKRAVLKKSTKIDIKTAFPPYSEEKLDKLKKLFK